MLRVARVVISISLDKEFDYFCPSHLEAKPGMRVLVDFNRKKRIGIVVAVISGPSFRKLKPIIDLLDSQALLGEEHLLFAKQLSNFYPYAKGEFLFMMFPPYLKKPRKLDLQLSSVGVNSKNAVENKFIKGESFLERYQLWKDIVKEKLKQGSVLICFPQLTFLKAARKIIERDFPDQTKVIHSQEGEKELFSSWSKTRENSLILGTRVAIFYYPTDLRLIVVEEENDHCYSQEEKPYHWLPDVAWVLSQIKSVGLILSGDYPSLATYKRIKEGTVRLLGKSNNSRPIGIIGTSEFNKSGVINPILTDLLQKAIQDKKKAIILWNRKGFAQVSCFSCGHIFKCQHCSGFLQSSLNSQEGICPYCQRKTLLPKICNQCNSGYLKSKGYGIQRLESSLRRMFPEVKIDNLANFSDDTQVTLSTSKVLSHLYDPVKFDRGFVLDADSFLNHLDYDATFTTFIYLRKLLRLLQDSLYVFTSHKDYYLFQQLNDRWEDFYELELRFRKKSQLPPFGLIAKITLRSKNKRTLLKNAKGLYDKLEGKFKEAYGPFEEKPFKLRDKFRYSLIVKTRKDSLSRKLIKEAVKDSRTSSIQLAVSLR
ncbi:MAG: hypothetical protein ABIE75_00350 [Candidatus Omnitrophota bacterium]